MPAAERPWPVRYDRIAEAGVVLRVMGPHERGRFTPEAWGHLLALKGSGALSASEMEHVIERAMAQIDGRIALEDLRTMLDGSGLDEGGPASGDGPVH